MERKLQILETSTSTKRVKLTIGPTRVTIKFPKSYDEDKKKVVISEFLKISEQILYIKDTFTLRGLLKETDEVKHITLYARKKKYNKFIIGT